MISKLRARNPLKPSGTPEEQVVQGARYTVDTIAAAGRGDAAAFMVLYYAKARAVSAYLAPAIPEEHERELQLRRVFLRAWQQLPSLERPEEFDLWLLRLADDEVRGTQELQTTSGAASDPVVGELFILPRRLREVLALRYFFGISKDQTALAFSVEVDQVDEWQRHGLEALSAARVPRSRLRRAA